MSATDQTVSNHHHSALHHQFDDLEQQRDAYSLGMWAFLVTEVMFLGGLFLVYTVYRYRYPLAFAEASSHLNLVISATNTVILLSSSLAIALGVRAAQLGQRKALVGYLTLTLILGLVFLGLKAVEYYEEYQAGLIPGPGFVYASDEHEVDNPEESGQSETAVDPRHVEIFFTLYFVMTGFHALHMVLGGLVLLVIIILAWRNRFPPEDYAPVEMMGLYWHFVDIVWVFLFPLLYLIHRSL